jgi:hypothetical protein
LNSYTPAGINPAPPETSPPRRIAVSGRGYKPTVTLSLRSRAIQLFWRNFLAGNFLDLSPFEIFIGRLDTFVG